jgi:hypothetical protein
MFDSSETGSLISLKNEWPLLMLWLTRMKHEMGRLRYYGFYIG